MKKSSLLIVLTFVFLMNANGQLPSKDYVSISIDKLIAQADRLAGEKVKVIGIAAHICGVDGNKMKLKSPSGAVLKIIPNNTNEHFDSYLKKKLLAVQGVVEVKQIKKEDVDKMEKEGILLCHIDYSFCKDKPWVNSKIENRCRCGDCKEKHCSFEENNA